MEKILNEEEMYWQQRGNEKWVLEGDTNSKFFHLKANGRKRKKSIVAMMDGEELTTDPARIQAIIYSYYKGLFGKPHERTVKLTEDAWSSLGRITEEDNSYITRPFTEEEIKQAVFGMRDDMAPGPDGFSITFYKHFWELIKGGLMRMVNDFYLENLDLARLNYGVITPIPKIKGANNVKQFRPICLLDVSFKIFTKLLVGRLCGLEDKIISKLQTAFIKGRFILDGVVMLHETMHELSRRKDKGVIFKVDFLKEYDSINWRFVEEVM